MEDNDEDEDEDEEEEAVLCPSVLLAGAYPPPLWGDRRSSSAASLGGEQLRHASAAAAPRSARTETLRGRPWPCAHGRPLPSKRRAGAPPPLAGCAPGRRPRAHGPAPRLRSGLSPSPTVGDGQTPL
ncbi:unnamed protein product [Prorocentrum cordatum]|uniref:Uncharacterized protein n=1 Tax=Prorocentrum cordatum TaxID=2364126 RepID=A0ABN9VN09_9DINO|nr:unnamed protein product [Polarella glacialis]